AGEGMAIADLDFALITKRKRMMDSVGHYARPELLKLLVDREAKAVMAERSPLQPEPTAVPTPIPEAMAGLEIPETVA
ncbi:MAG: hypothetical protein AAFY11_13050, partial [Cyanobacteria bacterium J06641_5]